MLFSILSFFWKRVLCIKQIVTSHGFTKPSEFSSNRNWNRIGQVSFQLGPIPNKLWSDLRVIPVCFWILILVWKSFRSRSLILPFIFLRKHIYKISSGTRIMEISGSAASMKKSPNTPITVYGEGHGENSRFDKGDPWKETRVWLSPALFSSILLRTSLAHTTSPPSPSADLRPKINFPSPPSISAPSLTNVPLTRSWIKGYAEQNGREEASRTCAKTHI